MAVGGGGGGTVANLQVVVGANVAGALLGFQTIQGAISAVVDTVKQFVSSGIEMNSFLESSELQFKTLTGSATAAHDKVSELFDLAAHTPFTFESVTVAARQLEVFGGAALDTEANLRMLGDAAAATAAPIEQVTFWTGRLYSALQAGESIGMATMWLQRMGVLSAEATQRMKALSDAGASADEVWKAFADSQQRFSGAMKEQEGTWKGLTSTMSDTLTLLTGEATHAGFVRLEGDIKKVNVALADPSGHQGAAALGQAFDMLVRAGEAVGSGIDVSVVQPLGHVGDAVDDVNRLAHLTGDQWSVIFGNDMPAALAVLSAALERVPEPLGAMESSGIRIASITEASNAEFAKAPPLIDQVRDSWASAAQEADHLAQAARNLVLERAKSPDLGGGDSATRAADQAAHDAEMQRIYDEGQALAHAGDISQIVAREQISARQFATQQAEKAAKETQKAQEDAAREAARAITEQNRAAQEQIRQQTQAAQEAVRRAYVETADEAEAQYERVAHATTGVAGLATDMQRDLDEALNLQVRGGTAGTTEAEKQLDDIRKKYLATIPDLVSIDQQWTAAKVQSRDADVALAAAERDLAVALAASGGQQTLQTAALSHAVTAAKDAAAAAHDHERALATERGETVAQTNALKGLGKATEDVATASKSLPDMGGGGAFSTLSTGAVVATREMDALKLSLKGYQKELDMMQEQANSIDLVTQRAGVAGQASDLATSEQTLGLRRQLLPLEQQMDLLKLAREATTHKERQKQLDKDIADTQLKIDSIQTQIGVKQRQNQARALDAEQAMIPIERQRLTMEDAILAVKQQQLAAQLDMNDAQRMLGAASSGWIKNADGTVSPPIMQLTDHGWQMQPQRNIQFNFNGNVVTTQQSFEQAVINAVQQADRESALKLTRYAAR